MGAFRINTYREREETGLGRGGSWALFSQHSPQPNLQGALNLRWDVWCDPMRGGSLQLSAVPEQKVDNSPRGKVVSKLASELGGGFHLAEMSCGECPWAEGLKRSKKKGERTRGGLDGSLHPD